MFFYDPTWILVIPAVLLALWAQFRVRSAYQHYSRVRSAAGLRGAEAAQRILHEEGLAHVSVEQVGGVLSDHYDPRTRTVRLSPQNYQGTSLAALAVAAHECGHALQHAKDYAPLRWRHALLPAANLGAGPLVWILLMAGFFFSMRPLIDLGIVFFGAAVAFHVVTLPVEFNASSRALAILSNRGYLVSHELEGAKKVLDAAALTYVASAAMAVLQLVRLLVIRNSMDD